MAASRKSENFLRLKKRAEFLRAAKGARAPTPAFLLQFIAVENATLPRFGVTATKKLGNAVVRNRAKRRIRALACKLMPKARPGDYVFIARPDILSRDFSVMEKDLEKALLRLSCLK